LWWMDPTERAWRKATLFSVITRLAGQRVL
jgi:hypothetical protein